MASCCRLTIILLFTSFTIAQKQPWLPSPLDKNWLALHNGFVSNNRVNGTNITVLFIKDSVTRRWQPDGLHLYIEHYVPLRTAGVGGDSAQDVLWTDREVDGIQPRVSILKIGTKNIPNGFTDSSIARGITAIVNELSEALPSTKILLVGVLRRNDAATSELIESIYRNVALLDNRNSVRFLNMVDRYHKRTGNFYDELCLNDLLPSNSQGYVKWNEVHLLLFDEMYNSATQPIIAGFYLVMLVCSSLIVFNYH
ncbi:platelet-activating factor acetylhydrolase IB subunit beta-like [Bradysia coprophila]|uniref:platelet-activating factor acetylhydrolase IB subunit beta-like n=1 Tax=Bradysia coprophila TaxID=38358 RepID=UPI00187DBDB3|nr:platelet-activating factor acetylhydrolase IB subunit beta-like [Bradysia coprophila]